MVCFGGSMVCFDGTKLGYEVALEFWWVINSKTDDWITGFGVARDWTNSLLESEIFYLPWIFFMRHSIHRILFFLLYTAWIVSIGSFLEMNFYHHCYFYTYFHDLMSSFPFLVGHFVGVLLLLVFWYFFDLGHGSLTVWAWIYPFASTLTFRLTLVDFMTFILSIASK